MLAFACTECGLSIEEFFKLSWYEWSLEIEKVNKRLRYDHLQWEKHAVLVREQMALFANANTGRNGRKYKGSDFFKLSFDTTEALEQKRLSPSDVDRLLSKRVKNG